MRVTVEIDRARSFASVVREYDDRLGRMVRGFRCRLLWVFVEVVFVSG